MPDAKKVLVVDDDLDLAALICRRLRKENFEVAEAYNGVEAIQKIEEYIPDCIVLDVMMPEKDGYAVCAELKKNPKCSDIAIVMLTAVADHVTSTRYSHYDGISMEADDYIPKGPDSIEQVVESVKYILS